MKSGIIFRNGNYTACAMKDGSLIVTRSRPQCGRRLIGEQATEWIDAINAAICRSEASALCRVLFNQ